MRKSKRASETPMNRPAYDLRPAPALCVLRSAFAKAPADANKPFTRRSFRVAGQAQDEENLGCTCADGRKNLLMLSLSKRARWWSNTAAQGAAPMRYLHTMVRVKDLDRSLHFYCDLLGLKEMRRIENEKGRFTLVFLAAPEDEERARADQAPMV